MDKCIWVEIDTENWLIMALDVFPNLRRTHFPEPVLAIKNFARTPPVGSLYIFNSGNGFLLKENDCSQY